MQTRTKLEITQDTLEVALTELMQHPSVQNHEDALYLAQQAIYHAAEARKLLAPLLQENQAMAREITENNILGIRSPIDSLTAETARFQKMLKTYQPVYEAGGSPELIDRMAKAAGINWIERTKLLRTLFNFELDQAKSIVEANGKD